MPATDGVFGSENLRVSVSFLQEVLPAHHHSHGTPDPMVRRWVEVEVDGSRAVLEQTDYGHPGRFNPPQLRRVSAALASREAQLQALVPVLADLAS